MRAPEASLKIPMRDSGSTDVGGSVQRISSSVSSGGIPEDSHERFWINRCRRLSPAHSELRTGGEKTFPPHCALVALGARDPRPSGSWILRGRLIAGANACILTTEILKALDFWLRINKHNSWPKETFGPRFEHHDGHSRPGQRGHRQRVSTQRLSDAVSTPCSLRSAPALSRA
jgi:hypothetical protein